MAPEQVKSTIARAFAAVAPPADWRLVESGEGDEPGRVAAAFAGRTDWRALDAAFLDAAPDGLGSALSFLSDEAYRFYLPAYLLADVDGRLQQADPVFSLTHGLDDDSRGELVNERRYGARTWFDVKRCKFAVFTAAEAGAIVAYLRCVGARDPFERPRIEQALTNYWLPRASTV